MSPQLLSYLALASNIIIGGGLAGVWLRYRLKIRGEDRVDFSSLNEELRRQRDEAFAKVDEQDQRIENLEAEVQGLRIARDLDPFPAWLVDLDGRYTFVNRPFEERFLEPQRKTHRDIIGKKGEDFWPEDFCRTIAQLDAASRKRPDGTARANTTLDVPGLGSSEVTVHKFPCRIKGVVVAFAGYITAIDPVDERIGWQKARA